MQPFTSSDVSQLTTGTVLADADGERAEVIALDADGAHPVATLRTEHGRIVRVSTDMIRMEQGGSGHVTFSLALLADEPSADPRDADATGLQADSSSVEQIVVPVVEEHLHIDRRQVDTGRGVRIAKTVAEREEVVDVPLGHDEIEVVRVPVNRTLGLGEQAIARHEGDTLIVPVLEEVLVVEKRWHVKEEVRITTHRRETHSAQRVVLRSEAVAVERFDEKKKSGLPDSGS